MTDPSNEVGLFVVDLRGLDLPPGAARSIATAIRRAALLELAVLDLAGPVTITYSRRSAADLASPSGEEWPAGLWLEPDARPVDV